MRFSARTVLVLTWLGSAALTVPVTAQSLLQGRATDEVTGEGVAGAAILVRTTSGDVVGRTITDTRGGFNVVLARGGFYRVSVERIGYTSRSTEPFWMEARDTVVVQLELPPDPVELGTLRVVARAKPLQSGVIVGFYRRVDRGLGHFWTREDIERDRPVVLTDMLRSVPGVRILGSGSPSQRNHIQMSRALPDAGGRGGCPVQVFLDGVLLTAQPLSTFRGPMGVPIDEVINPRDLEGIEVYRSMGTVPAEFQNTYSRCGVIVLWSRRGPAGSALHRP